MKPLLIRAAVVFTDASGGENVPSLANPASLNFYRLRK